MQIISPPNMCYLKCTPPSILIALIIFQADKSESWTSYFPFSYCIYSKVSHEQTWKKVNLTDKVTVGQWYNILLQPSPTSLLKIPGAFMLYIFTPWFLYMQNRRSLSILFLLDKNNTEKFTLSFSLINTLNHHKKICYIETSIQIHTKIQKTSLWGSLVFDSLKEDCKATLKCLECLFYLIKTTPEWVLRMLVENNRISVWVLKLDFLIKSTFTLNNMANNLN